MINQYVEFNIVKLFQSGMEFDSTILDSLNYWQTCRQKQFQFYSELKEFGSVNNEEKAPSENRGSFNGEHQKQPQQTAVFGQKIKE